jgi:MFS family permease
MKPKERSGMRSMFRTLRYRNFRLFFAGQGVSLVGTWMQHVAMGWLVYRMTNSPLMLGVVGFAGQIPTFIFSPFAGVMADRWNRRSLLMLTQGLSMAQAFILAALTLYGFVQTWHVVALSFFLGCVNAMDIPVRQSFLMEMVERKENLGNAIALNSLMFNSARLIGPSIAGVVVAILGEGACFLVNGVSFLAVIASLSAMRLTAPGPSDGKVRILEGVREGLSYAFGFLPMRMILSLLATISLTGMSYVVLMPVFARDILRGGPETLGFLMASAGVGALVATLYLASRRTIVGLGRLIPASAALFATGLMLFSFSRKLWVSVILLAITGFGMMANMAASNIILQTIADDDKRGRVMSFYTVAFMGMAPIGSLITGALASRIGVTATLVIGAGICIAASAVFATRLPLLRKAIHPIYRKLGIIPEVASGLNAASELVVPPED